MLPRAKKMHHYYVLRVLSDARGESALARSIIKKITIRSYDWHFNNTQRSVIVHTRGNTIIHINKYS